MDDVVDCSVDRVLLVRIDRIISGADKKGTAQTIAALITDDERCIGIDGKPRGKRPIPEFVNARNAITGATLLGVVAYFFVSSDTNKRGREAALAICEVLLANGAAASCWVPEHTSNGGLTPVGRACCAAPENKDTRLLAALLDADCTSVVGNDDDDDDEEQGDNGDNHSLPTVSEQTRKSNTGSPSKKQQSAAQSQKKKKRNQKGNVIVIEDDDDEVCVDGDDPNNNDASSFQFVSLVNFPCCSSGLPPLLLCAQNGNVHLMRFLAQQQQQQKWGCANPHVRGAVAGESVVHMAAHSGDVDCVAFSAELLGFGKRGEDGAVIDDVMDDNNGNSDDNDSSLEGKSPPGGKKRRGAQQQRQQTKQKQQQPFLSAATLDSLRCIRGATALHYAVDNSHSISSAQLHQQQRAVQVIDYLVNEHGCDCNARTNRGATPLLIAAEANSPQAVDALIRHGADPSIAAQDKVAPMDAAIRFGRVRIMQILMSVGVPVPALESPKPPPTPKRAAPSPKGKPRAKPNNSKGDKKKTSTAAAEKKKNEKKNNQTSKKKKKRTKGDSSDDDEEATSSDDDDSSSSSSSSSSDASSSSSSESSDSTTAARAKRNNVRTANRAANFAASKSRAAAIAAGKKKPEPKSKKKPATKATTGRQMRKKTRKVGKDASSSSSSDDDDDSSSDDDPNLAIALSESMQMMCEKQPPPGYLAQAISKGTKK